MASSKKQRVLGPSDVEVNEKEDSELCQESDDDGTDESENEFMDQVVGVEVESRPAEDIDFHGIKTHLQQLFLKANINLGDLTDTIISQNYIGGVFKQIDVDEDDDSMDDDSDDVVLGFITAINLTDKQEKECIKQLITILKSRCQSASPDMAEKVREMLHNPEDHVGFIINERYINLPPQLAVPSFRSLRKDLEKACQKKMNYAFKHFLMLCKTSHFKGASKGGNNPSLLYSNGEEELIAEMSDLQATWSVADERDSVANGRWDEDDMEATRTLLVFSADKLDSIISRLETEIAT